jgi:adenylate kinase family enzyme
MPLSGKSTLARRAAEQTGYGYLSTGDLARSLGMGLEDSIRTHDLSVSLNDQIQAEVLRLVREGPLIVDGFPRSIEQLHAVSDDMGDVNVVFVVENPLIIYDRLQRRMKMEGRPEDTTEVVAGRLRCSEEWRRELVSEAPQTRTVRGGDLANSVDVIGDIWGGEI